MDAAHGELEPCAGGAGHGLSLGLARVLACLASGHRGLNWCGDTNLGRTRNVGLMMRRPNFVNLAAEEISPLPLSVFPSPSANGRFARAFWDPGGKTGHPGRRAPGRRARRLPSPPGGPVDRPGAISGVERADFAQNSWIFSPGANWTASSPRRPKNGMKKNSSSFLFFFSFSCSAGEEKSLGPDWPGTPTMIPCSPGGRQVKIRRDLFWSQLLVN